MRGDAGTAPRNLQPIVMLLLSASSRASKLLERRLRYFWDADGAARLEIRAVFSFPANQLQLLLAPFVFALPYRRVSLKSRGFLLVTHSGLLFLCVENHTYTYLLCALCL